jgi:plasmid stabilization system protein ParE
MKVVYTDEALRNLDEILGYIGSSWPTVSEPFQHRLRAVAARIGAWPESAQEVAERPGVRVVPLIRYPYKVFYRVTSEAVEILYIHHAARRQPWKGEP